MRVTTLTLAAVAAIVLAIFTPGTANAQNGEVYGGFAYGRISAGTITIQPIGFLVEGTGYLTENIGITGEFFWGRDSDDIAGIVGASVDAVTAMGGVRFRFPNDSIVTPAVRVVAGIGHTNVEACVLVACADVSDQSFTMGFGGAIDIAAGEAIAIRVQPDFVVYEFDDTLFRLSGGVVFAS
jgi:hypothetical protein